MRKNEKVYYYSSTVENGKVVTHEGDPAHAVYLSEIRLTQARANRWHKWIESNVPDAYEWPGVVKDEIRSKYKHIMDQFMSGKKLK